jgi:phosphopantothenoylcysteine decarboxylase/phosphopantothenate--cysteine ligase
VANVLLGVSGSVAAYRAADLARELMRDGHTVRTCLTRSAAEFVRPALFEALTGEPCLVDVFEEPERGRMAHIDWARWADCVVVAPATADTLARLAQGRADDMLAAVALATAAPLVVAPAMNPSMFASDPVREALEALRGRAAVVVEPAEGDVACGEQGQGKLASTEAVRSAVAAVLARSNTWQGARILVTSGPTREPLDDVRFLSNRSSGKMGAAVARAGLLMGADVTVVAGPQEAPLPLGAEVVRVETALEMHDAVVGLAPGAAAVVGVAAVADYRPRERAVGKPGRGGAHAVELVENPDVIAAAARAAPGAVVVAFAAEVGDGLERAREKLGRKGVHAVALNDVSRPGIGMGSDYNELTFVTAGSSEPSGRLTKLECALWLLERAASLRQGA